MSFMEGHLGARWGERPQIKDFIGGVRNYGEGKKKSISSQQGEETLLSTCYDIY